MKWPEHDCPNHPPCSTCLFEARVEAVVAAARRTVAHRQGSILELRDALENLDG
jgi:hypothetical protein